MKFGFRILLIAWTIFMLIFSSIASFRLPTLYAKTADKILHCFEYIIWSILFLYMLKQEKRIKNLKKTLLTVIIFGFILALLDELHQFPIEGRDTDILDLISDFFGLLIGSLLFVIINISIIKKIMKVKIKEEL